MRVVLDVNIFDEGEPAQKTLMRAMVWFMLACLAAAIAASVPLCLTGFGPGLGDLLPFGAAAILGYCASLPVHELVHAAFFKLLGPQGTKVIFGFQSGMLYAGCPGVRLSRGRIVVVLLAPLVTLSIVYGLLGLVLPFTWTPLLAVWLFALHTSGCIGDLYFVALIIRYPEATVCEDTNKGIRLLAP